MDVWIITVALWLGVFVAFASAPIAKEIEVRNKKSRHRRAGV